SCSTAFPCISASAWLPKSMKAHYVSRPKLSDTTGFRQSKTSCRIPLPFASAKRSFAPAAQPAPLFKFKCRRISYARELSADLCGLPPLIHTFGLVARVQTPFFHCSMRVNSLLGVWYSPTAKQALPPQETPDSSPARALEGFGFGTFDHCFPSHSSISPLTYPFVAVF